MTQILKTIILGAAGLGMSLGVMAAPPKLMVLPDKAWLNDNNCLEKKEAQGKTKFIEKYDEAFLNQELKSVETEIKAMFSQMGFPLVSYTDQAASMDEDDAFDELYTSEEGNEITMDPFEAILNRAKPDIILRVNWTVNKLGMNYNLSYSIDAVDSYSNKSVVTVAGETEPCSRAMPLTAALKSGIRDKLPSFIQTLNEHFQKIQNQGREIKLNLRVVNNGTGLNFNKEYGDKTLGSIIFDWVRDNTVNHQVSEGVSTRNRLSYDQVLIPYRDPEGKPWQARQFVDGLRKHLKTLGISCENTSSGLGNGILVIGK